MSRSAFLLIFALSGCSTPLPDYLDDPELPLPELLSELGAFRGTKPVKQLVPYEPAYPLWSNGSRKDRALALPDGAVVDTSDPDAWGFPDGAMLFKTFSYDAGPVETRILRRIDGDWEYAVYWWDASGDDASLWDETTEPEVPVSVDGASFEHVVPNRLGCRTCHEAHADGVIGLDTRQLGATVDGVRQADGLQDWLSHDLPATEPISAADADEQYVKRYAVGNCVHCHDGTRGVNNSFDLSPDVFLDNIVGQPTESVASASGTRVIPGNSADSILFQALSGETDDPSVKPMPALGVQRIDADAVEVWRRWIDNLPESR